jgi:hypothetical protein
LELVAEILLDGELLKGLSLHNDVVFTLEYKAIDNKVFSLKQVGLLKELDQLLTVDRIVTFFDIHGNEIQLGFVLLLPPVDEGLISTHNIIVVEN